MKKRRIEIAVLAALMIFAAAERPSIERPTIALSSRVYQVGEFAPQRIETLRDLGVVAAKLALSWID